MRTAEYFTGMPVDIVFVGIVVRSLRSADRPAMITQQPFIKTGGAVRFLGHPENKRFVKSKYASIKKFMVH